MPTNYHNLYAKHYTVAHWCYLSEFLHDVGRRTRLGAVKNKNKFCGQWKRKIIISSVDIFRNTRKFTLSAPRKVTSSLYRLTECSFWQSSTPWVLRSAGSLLAFHQREGRQWGTVLSRGSPRAQPTSGSLRGAAIVDQLLCTFISNCDCVETWMHIVYLRYK